MIYPRGIGNHHGRETFSDLYTDHITIRNNAFTNMTVTAPNGKAIYDHTILLHSFKNALVENNTITNAGSGVLLVYDSKQYDTQQYDQCITIFRNYPF